MKEQSIMQVLSNIAFDAAPCLREGQIAEKARVPINVRLTPSEIESCLADSGATRIRRLMRGTDFDRVEQIYQSQSFAEIKFGGGENRFVFSKK